jgi:hypothetical protein
MNLYKTSLAATLIAVALSSRCDAQYTAPASIAPSLIQYATPMLPPGGTWIRLILYNTDGTDVEISSFSTSSSGKTTFAPHSGTYTYSIDPLNSSHAAIAYDGNTNPQTFDNLYFTAANDGTQVPPNQASAGGIGLPTFTFSPRVSSNGGINVSNRCELSSGGVAISGFVIQSTGPRWVLVRAVGATLAKFGVSGVVSSPSFTLYDSTQTVVGNSSVWSSDPNLAGGFSTIFALVGAFPLTGGSDEGVLLTRLNPGAYTGVFQGSGAGTILCEVYILPF